MSPMTVEAHRKTSLHEDLHVGALADVSLIVRGNINPQNVQPRTSEWYTSSLTLTSRALTFIRTLCMLPHSNHLSIAQI
jgi:hypothetical protein